MLLNILPKLPEIVLSVIFKVMRSCAQSSLHLAQLDTGFSAQLSEHNLKDNWRCPQQEGKRPSKKVVHSSQCVGWYSGPRFRENQFPIDTLTQQSSLPSQRPWGAHTKHRRASPDKFRRTSSKGKLRTTCGGTQRSSNGLTTPSINKRSFRPTCPFAGVHWFERESTLRVKVQGQQGTGSR